MSHLAGPGAPPADPQLPPAFAFLGWVRAEERFSEEACEAVVAVGRLFPAAPAPVGNDAVDPQARAAVRCRIGPEPRSQPLLDRLEELVVSVNRLHFGFDVTGLRPPELLEYSPGNGHFGWHRDFACHGGGQVRKLAIVVQLSDPGDYEGGSLEVLEPVPRALPRERGTVLALPSFLPHRVTPVTRGIRRALVVFALGPSFR